MVDPDLPIKSETRSFSRVNPRIGLINIVVGRREKYGGCSKLCQINRRLEVRNPMSQGLGYILLYLEWCWYAISLKILDLLLK